MGQELDKRFNAACDAGDLALAQRLKAEGADINNSGNGDPALLSAANRGHADVVAWLLENGANANITNNKLSTPLMCAAYNGHAACITLLLRFGANTALTNNDGKTAMKYARDQNKGAAITALEIRPDEVSSSWSIDNRVMQEIYDFRRLERVTLLRKAEGGDVEAMQRDAFSQLPDRGALQKAFEEHRRRGGKRTEDEVFDSGLGKLKMNIPRRRL